jgi:hypothetical protein
MTRAPIFAALPYIRNPQHRACSRGDHREQAAKRGGRLVGDGGFACVVVSQNRSFSP